MMISSPIVTDRLALRMLGESDANDTYLAWMNDPQVNKYLESRIRSFSRTDLASFVQSCNENPDILLLGITLKSDGRHIGNIKLGPIDRYHLIGDIGLLFGDPTTWGRGYAREAIAAVSQHAFDVLGLHKLTAGCYGGNVGSLRAFDACGFIVEGVRKQHYRSNGSWDDGIMMGRLSSQWADAG